MPSTTPTQLLRLALPLIPSSGFSLATLQLASKQLPHAPPSGFSAQTLAALFPSPPPAKRGPFAPVHSLSREELVKEAKGELGEVGEPVGPARALVEAWLGEGRRAMKEKVKGAGGPVEGKFRVGLHERVRYNEQVVEQLPQALALLGVLDHTTLGSALNTIRLPSPFPHAEHVARIAHDLALSAGAESQGVEWYQTRARLATIYGLAELHQISPAYPPDATPADRTAATLRLVDDLLEESARLGKRAGDAVGFVGWVGKSWAGMGRSLGL